MEENVFSMNEKEKIHNDNFEKEQKSDSLVETPQDSGPETSVPRILKKYDASHKDERRKVHRLFTFTKLRLKSQRGPDGDRPNMSKLNLVVCGSNNAFQSSITELILQQTERRSEHMWSEVKSHGRLINLVELPALFNLSEEEVMRHTLNCVSYFNPGVNAFLLVIHAGPLTDNERGEIEKIQIIFNSRQHFILLFTTVPAVGQPVMELLESCPKSQELINLYGGQHKMIGLNEHEKIPELLDYIENNKTEPYSLLMYVKAQADRARHEAMEKYKEDLKRMTDEIKHLKQIQSEGADGEADDQKSLRIVLIGKTGSGKSATGNTILGRDEFQSQLSTDSVTAVCKKEVGEVAGRSVAVVDTPGLFDTTLSNDQVPEEIMKCVSLSSPGPHVFVIVLTVGRFTKEETDTLDLIKKIFGPKSAQFSIVLFTRGDELGNESIQDYVKRSTNAELKKLIRDCGNRFLAVNNREKQDKTQVIQLLNMIEEVKNTNESRYFTNSMFEEAEMSIKKRMEQILKEREREIQAQKEELQAKYEMDIKRLEEEKQRANEERIKIENQFRENEEKLRKEFEDKEKMEQIKLEHENRKRSEEEKQKKAEYHKEIEEMKKEMENTKSQLKERDEEDRNVKEKYRKDQEEMKNEHECTISILKKRHNEEIKWWELEQQRRDQEEEKERQGWERKIKEADNEKKESQEDIKQQQREWENEKIQQMREREEEERKRKERHKEQLREKQEELEKLGKKLERKKEEERHKIEKERQKQRREQEEKERKFEEKTHEVRKYYEQMEQEWKRQKQKYDKRQEEERKRSKKIIEDLKQEREEEIKKREKEEKERGEREEEERYKIMKAFEEKVKEMKKKNEDEARKQAEKSHELTERKEELQQMLLEHQKEHEILKNLYTLLQVQKQQGMKKMKQKVENLHDRLQEAENGEELKKLLEETQKILEKKENNKSGCVIF